MPYREAVFLVSKNVPIDIAFGMDDVTRAAWCIILSEQDGAEFDIDAMQFKERT